MEYYFKAKGDKVLTFSLLWTIYLELCQIFSENKAQRGKNSTLNKSSKNF